jgi:hypothetical protein
MFMDKIMDYIGVKEEQVLNYFQKKGERIFDVVGVKEEQLMDKIASMKDIHVLPDDLESTTILKQNSQPIKVFVGKSSDLLPVIDVYKKLFKEANAHGGNLLLYSKKENSPWKGFYLEGNLYKCDFNRPFQEQLNKIEEELNYDKQVDYIAKLADEFKI